MKRTPRVDTVQSIADGLGITSASLMGGMASLEQSQPNEAAKKLRLFQLILGISDEAEIDDLLAHVEDVLGIEPPDDQSLLPKYAKKAR